MVWNDYICTVILADVDFENDNLNEWAAINHKSVLRKGDFTTVAGSVVVQAQLCEIRRFTHTCMGCLFI